MTSALPAAAWFPDPSDPARLRWWDGANWTEHVPPPLEPAVQVEAPLPDTSRGFEGVRIGTGIGVSVTTANRPDGEDLIGRRGARPGAYAVATHVSRSATREATPAEAGQVEAGLVGEGLERDDARAVVGFMQRALRSFAWLERNRIASRIVHHQLRRQAREVARTGRASSRMDVTFAGVRYQARGSNLD